MQHGHNIFYQYIFSTDLYLLFYAAKLNASDTSLSTTINIDDIIVAFLITIVITYSEPNREKNSLFTKKEQTKINLI